FCGVVRDHDHGRGVTALTYECHPDAEAMLAQVAADFAALPGVKAIAVSHRVGPLTVGDVALVCAVSSTHRREALTVCADLVDAIKARVAIWKHQTFSDDTTEWVNCP